MIEKSKEWRKPIRPEFKFPEVSNNVEVVQSVQLATASVRGEKPRLSEFQQSGENQDTVGVASSENGSTQVAVIADGTSSSHYPEIGSRLVVKTLLKLAQSQAAKLEAAARDLVRDVNQQLIYLKENRGYGVDDPAYITTMSLAAIFHEPNKDSIGLMTMNLGDSRLYSLRIVNGRPILECLTLDTNPVTAKMKRFGYGLDTSLLVQAWTGGSSRAQLPEKIQAQDWDVQWAEKGYQISMALPHHKTGTALDEGELLEAVRDNTHFFTIEPGTIILGCTDGVSDGFTEAKMEQLLFEQLSKGVPLEQVLQNLCQLGQERAGDDATMFGMIVPELKDSSGQPEHTRTAPAQTHQTSGAPTKTRLVRPSAMQQPAQERVAPSKKEFSQWREQAKFRPGDIVLVVDEANEWDYTKGEVISTDLELNVTVRFTEKRFFGPDRHTEVVFRQEQLRQANNP